MKINCNVAQDLMQPYVEDILSRDSRELLKEHLEGCEACRAKLEEIRGINKELDGEIGEAGAGSGAVAAEATEDVATFKNFKKWIDYRRAIAMIVAAVMVVTAIAGFAFWVEEYQTYIPYVESGVKVSSEGDVYTDMPYQMCKILTTPVRTEEGYQYVAFIYLTSSFKSRNLEKPGEIEILTNPKADFWVQAENEDEPTVLTAMYYASSSTLNKTKSFSFHKELLISPYLTDEERQEQLDKLIADSVLIWEKED